MKLEDQIKKKEVELEALKEQFREHDWPKKTVIYLHNSKEDNYDIGSDLCLSDNAMNSFSYAFCEIDFHITVNKDGSYDIDEIHEGDNVFVPRV